MATEAKTERGDVRSQLGNPKITFVTGKFLLDLLL